MDKPGLTDHTQVMTLVELRFSDLSTSIARLDCAGLDRILRANMQFTRNQEMWGVALWVEKAHGDSGWLFIAQQQDRLLAAGDLDGVAMWREVSLRYEQLEGAGPTVRLPQ